LRTIQKDMCDVSAQRQALEKQFRRSSFFENGVKSLENINDGKKSNRRVVKMFDPLGTVQTALMKMIKGITGSDVTLGLVFLGLWMYRRSRLKKGAEIDPDAPRISGANLNFIAQTPEDEAKLKTMHCDDCGFTIYVAKNRFKLHFKDGLRCLNCGAVAPVFYNQNDLNDPLNKEGATIDDFQEEEYFASELNVTELNAALNATSTQQGEDLSDVKSISTSPDKEEDAVLPSPEAKQVEEEIVTEEKSTRVHQEDITPPVAPPVTEEVAPSVVDNSSMEKELSVEAAIVDEKEQGQVVTDVPVDEKEDKPSVIVLQDDVPEKEELVGAATTTISAEETEARPTTTKKPTIKPGDPVPAELSVFKDLGVL